MLSNCFGCLVQVGVAFISLLVLEELMQLPSVLQERYLMFLAFENELFVYQVVVQEVGDAAAHLHQHLEATLKGCFILLSELEIGASCLVLSETTVNQA